MNVHLELHLAIHSTDGVIDRYHEDDCSLREGCHPTYCDTKFNPHNTIRYDAVHHAHKTYITLWFVAHFTRSNMKLECGPMTNVMVALPNIGGVLSSIQRRKVWLTPTITVPCSNAVNKLIGERRIWTQSDVSTWQNSVRGQEPPKMYT